ncbi:peptidase [Nostoc sp. 3335mG]|nr:peptidase [Nostoc sp. 3335mG]
MSRASSLPFWTSLHRWLGLGSMLFLFLAAVTGCLLCVDKTIDAAINTDLFHVAADRPASPPVEAVARFEASHPGLRVTSFPLAIPPGRTIAATVAAREGRPRIDYDQAFIDPSDGSLVGVRKSGPGWDRRHIVEGVYEFHYTLLAGTWGRWLMGVMAFAWLIGNLIGFYLTLPLRGAFWKKWKRSWQIDWKARLRWLMLDLHRASGLWLFAGVVILAFTSVSMNFFDEAYSPALSAISPARPSPFNTVPPKTVGTHALGFRHALETAERLATRRGLSWHPASISYLPDRNLYGVMFTGSGQVAYRGLGPVTLYVDGANGALAYADDPYSDSAGRKASRMLYPLHSGEVIGPIGIAIVFLLGVATAEMCVSGFYVWWKKRQSRRAMERAKLQSKVAA